MKNRILIVLFCMIAFSGQSNAQVRDWLKKQKRKAEESRYVKKTQESLKQISPNEYVKRKINEKFSLNSYMQSIKRKQWELKNVYGKNVTFSKQSVINFEEGFRKAAVDNKELLLLDSEPIQLKYPGLSKLEGKEYSVYYLDEKFIAVSESKIPVDQDLEKVIKTSYCSHRIDIINDEYLNNIKMIAKVNGEYFGYMLLFYDAGINIYNKLASISYGGVSAITLIDKYSVAKGNGSSISSSRVFKQHRKELKTMQKESQEISQSCERILKLKSKIKTSNCIDYKDVEVGLQDFKLIAEDINSLANKIADARIEVAKVRKEFSSVSDFYGISFIESIGSLYKYLEDYYLLMEEGLTSKSEDFNDFVLDVNTESKKMYVDSKNYFDVKMKNQMDNEIMYVDDLLLVREGIKKSEVMKSNRSGYVVYLNNLNQEKEGLLVSKEKDYVRFSQDLIKIKHSYENFPAEDAVKYYESVLLNIDENQIVGGSFYSDYSQKIVDKVKAVQKDKSKTKSLVASGHELDVYYQETERNNIFFYVVVGVALVILVVIAIVIRKKRKQAGVFSA